MSKSGLENSPAWSDDIQWLMVCRVVTVATSVQTDCGPICSKNIWDKTTRMLPKRDETFQIPLPAPIQVLSDISGEQCGQEGGGLWVHFGHPEWLQLFNLTKYRKNRNKWVLSRWLHTRHGDSLNGLMSLKMSRKHHHRPNTEWGNNFWRNGGPRRKWETLSLKAFCWRAFCQIISFCQKGCIIRSHKTWEASVVGWVGMGFHSGEWFVSCK